MAQASSSLRIQLGGTAAVFCVHDRKKDEVVTEEFAAQLLLEATGIKYDSRLHKLHKCSCCRNLFWAPHGEPTLCDTCLTAPFHAPGGPLPEPKGVVG